MHTAETYFGFHRGATLSEIRRGAAWTMWFGHVEAWGYTVDETWWFLDPASHSTRLLITHRKDEVEQLMADRFNACSSVLRYSGDTLDFGVPIHGPMNCVTQCAALIGIRAFTPAGLQRKLLAVGAEVIHEAERRPRGPQGATA